MISFTLMYGELGPCISRDASVSRDTKEVPS